MLMPRVAPKQSLDSRGIRQFDSKTDREWLEAFYGPHCEDRRFLWGCKTRSDAIPVYS
jgi:hypothetical protein